MFCKTLHTKHTALAVAVVSGLAYSSFAAASYPSWKADTYYAAGTIVSYQGGDYKAWVNQTDYSGTGWNPSVGSLWQYIGADSGGSSGSTSSGSGSSSGGSTSSGATTGSSSSSSGSASTTSCYSGWSSSKVYYGGNTASYNSVNYKANWWTQGENPASHSGPSGSGQPWTKVASCGTTTSSGGTGSSGGTSGSGGGTSGGSSTPPPSGFVFGPYKDITVNMDWNTNVMSTMVKGSRQSALSAMPGKLKTLTWSFATGECGGENWGGIPASSVASANVQRFVDAGKYYIISTGGAAGSFSCGSDSGFQKFIQTYYSANMLGVDFDIEAGQSQSTINSLVQRVKNAQSKYPGMRFSFTLATLAGSDTQSLGNAGVMVMNAIKSIGLSNYIINLMAMDYGSTSAYNCTIGSNGLCDMGASAVKSAQNLHAAYGVPYSKIEVTPMIGGNDTQNESFTLSDATTLSNFAKSNGLAGIHFWSFDRDNDCAPGYASPTCNSYGQAGVLGFTNRFIQSLGL